MAETALARLAARATSELQKLVDAGPTSVGVSRGTLLQKLLPRADPRWAEAVEAALVARGTIVLAGDEARAPGRDDLAGSDRELSARIADVFRRAGPRAALAFRGGRRSSSVTRR